MSRKVDHEERKREIAVKAIRLFSKVGYDNVSLIMIAAATGVSRTVLYRYFCDKREILDAAIFQVTDEIAARCRKVIQQPGTVVEKLSRVCDVVIDLMFANKEFLIAVFDFVVGQVRSGADMNGRIAKFTSGTRRALKYLVARGIKSGELNSVLKLNRTTDALYAEFESAAMRIVLGTENTPDAAKLRFADVIRAISAWK